MSGLLSPRQNMVRRTRGFTAKVIFLSLQTIAASLASAQSLLILDCQGFTRAAQKVDPGKLSRVQVNVGEAAGTPANGTQVSLTNAATGETVTATAKNGVVVFENVQAGAFTVTTAQANVTVGTVSVGSMGVGTVAATGVVATTAVLGTGGAVAAGTVVNDQVIDDDNQDDEDDSGGSDGGSGPGGDGSGTPPGDGSGVPGSEVPGSGSPGGGGGSGGDESCPICDPNEDPPQLDDDDFFDDAPISPFE